MRRLLDRNGGVLSEFHYDPDKDTAIISTVCDAEPLIERNKALQNDGSNGFTKSREMRHVGSIDPATYLRWIHELGYDHFRWMRLGKAERSRLLRRKLNDSDYRAFKTCSGRI